MTHSGMTVSVCWWGLDVRSVLRTHGLLLRVCVLEPATAQPDRALSHGAELKPPRLPDPAAGGAARPTHTYTCTLLQEKTSSWRQHHPQQVSSEHFSQGFSLLFRYLALLSFFLKKKIFKCDWLVSNRYLWPSVCSGILAECFAL